MHMGTLRKLKNIVSDTIDYADKVRKTVNDEDYLRKGHEFEKFVTGLFNGQYFSIVNWTHDQDHKHGGVNVESDKEPDLRVRYKPTGEEFFVECKYRTHLGAENKLEWANENSLRKYQRYSQEMPVFVVVGLGGEPASPERMFCIPLSEARWIGLYPSVYLKHERNPKSGFFWRNGVLT